MQIGRRGPNTLQHASFIGASVEGPLKKRPGFDRQAFWLPGGCGLLGGAMDALTGAGDREMDVEGACCALGGNEEPKPSPEPTSLPRNSLLSRIVRRLH